MNLLQALRHFVVEALLNMKRGWKVSLLAILITAVSLFLGGALFLFGSNLAAALDSWESQARLVVYMEPQASADALASVERAIPALDGLVRWEMVSSGEAEERLRERLPELGELLQGLGEAPLPASFEIELRTEARKDSETTAWIERVQQIPEVSGVDDDRHWIREIAFASAILRLGAAAIEVLLMAGSIFIIASVIRLAALLHRAEIRVQRLVGATEFFVRGPFVVQGILQGLVGSLGALGALSLLYVVFDKRELPGLLEELLLSSFLSPSELFLIVLLGTGAGLVGGLLSVRRTASGLW